MNNGKIYNSLSEISEYEIPFLKTNYVFYLYQK